MLNDSYLNSLATKGMLLVMQFILTTEGYCWTPPLGLDLLPVSSPLLLHDTVLQRHLPPLGSHS